jgi:hypothetical protein
MVFGIMAGLDNFQAGCVPGMLPPTRGRKLALSLAGLLAGQFVRAPILTVRLLGAIALLTSGRTAPICPGLNAA